MSIVSPTSLNLRPVLNILGATVVAAGLAGAVPARGENWRRDILTAANLAGQKVKGAFTILPDGGPDGDATIVFDDPVKASGEITIDLEGVDLTGFDQLHFDLWLENDVVDITATLRGYPDAHRGRRWYVMKRFQPLGEWTDIRLDLNMDDDLSGVSFPEAEKSLVIAFQRPDTASAAFARARIHQVRLVRNPLKIALDYRESATVETAAGLTLAYPVHVENTSDRPLAVRLEIVSETLKHFQSSLAAPEMTLAAGERRTTRVELAVGAAALADLPTGHVERAQVRAVVPGLPGFDTVPIRGFRPLYLFGFVPPSREARNAIFERLQAEAQKKSDKIASYEGLLRWTVEKPPIDMTPAHPAGFRCPECKSWLDMDSLYTHFCYSRDISGKCEKHQQRVTIDKHHPLFRSQLHNYHGKVAGIARNLALGWLRTGDQRLADKAMEILAAYQGCYRDLQPVAPNSTAFQSRFCSGSLFERHFLESMIDAWLILQRTGAGEPDKLRAVADGLLLDSLHVVNQFYYSFSASQIDMVTQALKASMILEKWPFAADAIGGDSGVQRILARNFDADGVPTGGGDYATQAASQIMTLAAALTSLGIAVEQTRLDDIARNSRLMGYLPRPKDYQMKTSVLDNTGFTILANGEGPTRRRATINWGSGRERGGHDHLTTELFDAADRELLIRTRRVMWGHPQSFFAFQSFAQNIPVVDQGNISTARLHQEFLLDTPQAAGVVISDYPERPAYPDSRLTRSLVLFNGCLLVVDRFVSSAGERVVDFPLNGLAKLVAQPEGMEPYTDELGQTPAYRLPHDLHVKTVAAQPFVARWVEGERGTRLHALGDGFQAFAGKTYMGYGGRSVPRDFLMLRTRGQAVIAAFLYEATHGDQAKVTRFVRAAAADPAGKPVGERQAVAYDVSFDNGSLVRLLISLDGGAYRADEVGVDGKTRIALHETRH